MKVVDAGGGGGRTRPQAELKKGVGTPWYTIRVYPIAVYRSSFFIGFLQLWLNIPFFSSLGKFVSQQNPKIYLRRGGGDISLTSIVKQTF